MYVPSAPAISILTLIGARSARLQPRNIETGFWNLLAKPMGDSSATGIPIILGFEPENSYTVLSTGAADEVPVCIELVVDIGAQGPPFKAARVINHPGIAEDLWMWNSIGAKFLGTSTRINIAGIRANWTFVREEGYPDFVLDLNGDTVAKQAGGIMHFGSNIPASVGGELVTVVGVPVASC